MNEKTKVVEVDFPPEFNAMASYYDTDLRILFVNQNYCDDRQAFSLNTQAVQT